MRATMRRAALAAAAAAAIGIGGPGAGAQEAAPVSLKARARQVLETYRDAVVTVKAAIKMTGGFGGGDQKVEITGTVVDPSGLTVVSESDLDPMSMIAGMMGGMGDENPFGNIQSDAGDVKLVMKDGKEIPARVVLRDKDLDLAFLVPEEKGLKFTHVPMEVGKAPEVLDDLIVVSRLGKNLDRTPTVSLSTVSAVVKKPRTFFVSDSAGSMLNLGCPAFDAGGKAVGLLLKRRASEGGGGIAAMVRGMMPVILPCDDVMEGAKQALEAAAKPAPKKEEPKEAPPAEGDEAPKKEEPKEPAPAPSEDAPKEGEKKDEK